MANTVTETTRPTGDVGFLADGAQRVSLVGEERNESGVPLVGEDDVTALIQAGHARGVAVEMGGGTGAFLREKPFHLPATDPRNSSTHPRGPSIPRAPAFQGLDAGSRRGQSRVVANLDWC